MMAAWPQPQSFGGKLHAHARRGCGDRQLRYRCACRVQLALSLPRPSSSASWRHTSPAFHQAALTAVLACHHVTTKATTWQPWRRVECRADLALTLPDGRRQAAFAPRTRTTLRLCATRADACNAERESAHWPVTLLSGDAASLAPLFARGFRPALVAGRLQMVLQGARRLAGLHARPRHRGWQGGRGCRQAVPREQGPRQGGRGSRRRSCGPGRRVGRGRAAADRGGRLAHH